jgi:hypothetical protein
VVELAEASGALLGSGRRVLLGHDPDLDRHLEEGDAPRAQHAGDLAHGGAVVGHVLEHVVADQEVDRSVA